MNPNTTRNISIVKDLSLGNSEKIRLLIESNQGALLNENLLDKEKAFEQALASGIELGDAIESPRIYLRDSKPPTPYVFETPLRSTDPIPVLGSLSLKFLIYRPTSDMYHPSITGTWITDGMPCLTEYVSPKMFDEKNSAYTPHALGILQLLTQSIDAYGRMNKPPA